MCFKIDRITSTQIDLSLKVRAGKVWQTDKQILDKNNSAPLMIQSLEVERKPDMQLM